jgi:S1-C subfamily serine protease
VADAVFLVEASEREEAAPPRPRLGITIEQTEDGVRVLEVEEGSLAEATDLRPGDVIVAAAATPNLRAAALIEIVQRQAPGTWLPLEVKRDEEILQLIAKFPPRLD